MNKQNPFSGLILLCFCNAMLQRGVDEETWIPIPFVLKTLTDAKAGTHLLTTGLLLSLNFRVQGLNLLHFIFKVLLIRHYFCSSPSSL